MYFWRFVCPRTGAIFNVLLRDFGQGRSKIVAAFGRKPLNFRIPSDLAATLEQPCFGCPQTFFLDKTRCVAKMNTSTFHHFNVDVFFFQESQQHILHGDGNASRALREGARLFSKHRCFGRPPALTRRLDV
jgi:hypothetical protein